VIKFCVSTLVLAAVYGCTSGSSALLDTARFLMTKSEAKSSSPTLKPGYRYIRITLSGIPTYSVLGNMDSDTEVWYTTGGEVIRLHGGRLAGTAGLPVDWRAVELTSVPSWGQALRGGAAYLRQRDVMPGYGTGMRETVEIRPVVPPSHSELIGMAPDTLTWFEETVASLPSEAALPPARFAVRMSDGGARVVYSEQCLSASLCLTFQPWPPTGVEPSDARSRLAP
jgi:hypothetical protein